MSQNIGRTSLAYSRSWHLIDMAADQRSLGRIATSIAITLMGKHKPIYDPSTDCGDYVVAVGCHDLHTTGKKMQKKKYYSHSMRPGRLQEITMERMMAKYGGAEVLRRAVSGMLPKNRLRDIRLARLKMFEGPGHPYKKNIVKLNDLTVRAATESVSKTPVTDAIKAELAVSV
ncbi:mitochondrial 54S ribosomal protein YmL23 [Sphaerosporella brunnea]|uniref:Large ribosomal subunit protein uL13m n=1 Tax=Sphaerosporella brunnea TaxID=1250544 RepID=A0A5J5EUA6_9PEZI|nr:mitochondrial 54S ribosomal protein YmL23 [Sphaerosporella brunnea]